MQRVEAPEVWSRSKFGVQLRGCMAESTVGCANKDRKASRDQQPFVLINEKGRQAALAVLIRTLWFERFL